MPDPTRSTVSDVNQPRSTTVVILAATALGVVVLTAGIWLGRGASDPSGATAGLANTAGAANTAGLANASATGAEGPADTVAGGQGLADSGQANSGSNDAVQPRDAADARGAKQVGDASESPGDLAQPAGETGRAAEAGQASEKAGQASDEAAGRAAAETGQDSDAGPAATYQVTWAETEIDGLQAAEQGNVGQPTFVWFHADWCHVCQEIKPTLVKMREDYKSQVAFIMVNVDAPEAQTANRKYQVRGTPTFVLFAADGEKLSQFSGWPGEAQVAELLNRAAALQ